MHSHDDELLRNAFDELRRFDREHTPPFQLCRAAALGGRPTLLQRLSFALAASSILLIVATTSVVMLRRTQTTTVSSIPVEWKGPTDFLLVTPGSELGSSVPQIPSPVPHYSLKGNSK